MTLDPDFKNMPLFDV